MSITITSFNGSAITGLTSPTYAFSLDGQTPEMKRYVCTTLGGTQAGVAVHTVSSPFLVEATRPKILRVLPQPVNGRYPSVPKNVYRIRVRKGMLAAAGLSSIGEFDGTFAIPAGAETYDQQNVAAFASAVGGLVANQIAGLFDSFKTGTM